MQWCIGGLCVCGVVWMGCGGSPYSPELSDEPAPPGEDEAAGLEEEATVTVDEGQAVAEMDDDTNTVSRSPDPLTSSAERVAGALNAFALDVYTAAHSTNRSWVFSPTAHADALVRLAARRGGRTLTQLAMVLHGDEIDGSPLGALTRESALLGRAAAPSLGCLGDGPVSWASRDGSFVTSRGVVPVGDIAARGVFSYAHAGGAQVVEVRSGERLSLLVVEPDLTDGLSRIEARLPSLLTRWLGALAPAALEVRLPAELLGAGCMSRPAEAETGVRPEAPRVFAVDHPFLYFVGDRRTGLVLAMGRFVGVSGDTATRRVGVE
jgi:hypothetical protein